MRTPRHVLIIVQNLPVPLDRRVWLECHALRGQGYAGHRDLPEGSGGPTPGRLDGVGSASTRLLLRRGRGGFAWEFAYSWVRTAACPSRSGARVGSSHPGLQPTGHLLVAGPAVAAARSPVRLRPARPQPGAVPVPLRRARRGSGCPPAPGRCCWLERMTYRTADQVISTNESYRQVGRSGEVPRQRRGDGRAQRS